MTYPSVSDVAPTREERCCDISHPASTCAGGAASFKPQALRHSEGHYRA